MSLISRTLPPGVDSTGSTEIYHDSVQTQSKPHSKEHKEDERDSGYEDNKEDLDSDMERRPRARRVKKAAAPAIPQRNERRASRNLDNLLLDLTSMDGTKDEQRTSIVVEDPHEVYLSSEEDASLSDYEGSFLDSDMDEMIEIGEAQPVSRPSSRKSQEDTARVVSFVMVGKPQIVQINLHSPTSSPKRQSAADSLVSAARPTPVKRLSKRPAPLKLFPAHDERRSSVLSVASTATTSTVPSRITPPEHSTSYIAYNPSQNASKPAAPPAPHSIRKSSRLAANLSSLKTTLQSHARSDTAHTLGLYTNPTASHSALPSQPAPQHAFLNMDPFEAAHCQSPTNDEPTPPTPKTPTGMSSSTWRMMSGKGRDGMMRTLSKARKGSMGKLNLAYNNSAAHPRQHSNDSKISLAMTTSGEHENDDMLPVKQRFSGEREPSMLQRRSVTMPMQLASNEARRPSTSSSSSRGEPAPVRGKYENMLRKAVAKPTTPMPPMPTSPDQASRKGMAMRMGLGRKKSLRA